MRATRQRLDGRHLMAMAALATLLGGCATTPVAPAITPAMQSHSGAPLQTLKAGRELFVYRCTSCHTVEPVGSHPMSFWRASVREMAGRSKLTATDEAAILAYLAAVRELPGG
jgi:hypothetical protein